LREARRLKLGIEVAVLMSLSAYLFVFLTYFFSEIIIGFKNENLPLLAKSQLIILLIVIIPVLSLSALLRPWNSDKLMSR